MRLDIFLSKDPTVKTRTRAKNLIEMNCVTVNGNICSKCAYEVKNNDHIEIKHNYEASLGGIKLKKAIEKFAPDIKSKICLDLGAANGGFTEILLLNNAKKVYALDVGKCALPERLIINERVSVKDKTNARYITKNDFDDEIEFITGDLSFISLKLILKPAYDVLTENGKAIFLIKPQFETDKKFLTKSGIVKDEKIRQKIISGIKQFAIGIGYEVLGVIDAPHPFPDKNQEYLIYLQK